MSKRSGLPSEIVAAMQQELKAIGGRLKMCRIAANLSLTDVAAELRVSRQAVSSWEVGRTECGAVQLAALMRVYGASADYVLQGVQTKPIGGRMLTDIFREREAGQAEWPYGL
jgi:transcriptional regulator with XRE-family HTH domain